MPPIRRDHRERIRFSLTHFGPATGRELRERLRIDVNACQKALQRLVRDGIVERTGSPRWPTYRIRGQKGSEHEPR